MLIHLFHGSTFYLQRSYTYDFAMVEFQAGKGGELTHDETTIISGALDLTEKVWHPYVDKKK